MNVKDLRAEILRRLEAGETNAAICRDLKASKDTVNNISVANNIQEKRLKALEALQEEVTREFQNGTTLDELSERYQRSLSTIRVWIRKVQPGLLAPRKNTVDDLLYENLPPVSPQDIYRGGWQLNKKRIVEPTEGQGGFTAHRQSLRQGVSA